MNIDTAARLLAESICAEYPSDHMTCSEADALAVFLYVAGHREAAVSVLWYHAVDDDEGDAHHGAMDPDQGYDSDRSVQWLASYLDTATGAEG